MFEMTVRPDERMPVPHHHESWDETVYGLTGTTTCRIGGEDTPVESERVTFGVQRCVGGSARPVLRDRYGG